MRHTSRFLAALLITTNLCYAATPAAAPAAKSSDTSTYELLNLFGEVFDRVRSDYVEPVADDKLIESALNGMLTSLDPHSNYMNEKQFSDMRIQTKGEFGGLGIEVTMENGLVKVVSPIDDTPASKAGVKPGDFISEIDNVAVMGLTLQEAVDKMRGAIGSPVKITILREGLKEPLPITIKRDLIKIQSIKSHTEDDVIYLRITSFSENTADVMKAAYEKEKKAIGPKLKGVVLDLRNNPGGLLDQAVEVSDAFLDHGEIVSTRSRKSEDSRRFSAKPGDIAAGLPMVVLINEGSASASEIVAGALKDHKRAVILGVKSFGKGSVQTVIPIEGHGAIRLTTARYYTPSGVSIQAKGITPDIMVQQAKLEALKANDNFSEENLPGHLINTDKDDDSTTPKEKDAVKIPNLPVDPKSVKKDKDGKPVKDGKDAADDYQLSRALDLIRALSIYQKSTDTTDTITPTPNTPVPAATPTVTPVPTNKK